jgi:hypothetical protein
MSRATGRLHCACGWRTRARPRRAAASAMSSSGRANPLGGYSTCRRAAGRRSRPVAHGDYAASSASRGTIVLAHHDAVHGPQSDHRGDVDRGAGQGALKSDREPPSCPATMVVMPCRISDSARPSSSRCRRRGNGCRRIRGEHQATVDRLRPREAGAEARDAVTLHQCTPTREPARRSVVDGRTAGTTEADWRQWSRGRASPAASMEVW